MPQRDASVLIVGAGPTGLNLALQLHRRGVPFHLIDQHDGPGEASRALVVQARTLEFYAQLGLAEQFVAAGTRVERVHVREQGEEAGVIPLADAGEGLSAYPFALCLPQDEHERLLVEILGREGVVIEWQTKLERLELHEEQVAVTLTGNGQPAQRSYAYVAGCDGARSRVRESLGIKMPGGEYDRLYYVADVKPATPPGNDLVVALDQGDFALMLPARRGENERLIGYVPRGREVQPSFDDVRSDVKRLLGLDAGELNWFSTYRVHHRVAERFRAGRAFLLGDAGHLHSPVGGQGMNTGIGDAVNLGWKLAAVVQGHASETLLDSYEPERIAFARSLVATTDRAFEILTNAGFVGRVFRTWVLPRVVPAATHFEAARHAMFGVISQIRIAYPDSPLSEGKAGIDSGERLPWVKFEGADNFAPLRSLQWQVHVYGEAAPELVAACRQRGLQLECFTWQDAMSAAGLARDALYLVRPDGHVALAAARDATQRLVAYVNRFALQFALTTSSRPSRAAT